MHLMEFLCAMKMKFSVNHFRCRKSNRAMVRVHATYPDFFLHLSSQVRYGESNPFNRSLSY